MALRRERAEVRQGDWLEAPGPDGPRRGEVVEVLGVPLHEHYQVRWSERHESIVFPGDGVRIVCRAPA